VVVMVVVMMVMAGGKCGRAGKHHQKENCSENLFHGSHPSRVDFVTEAPCRTSNQESNEGKTEDENLLVRLSFRRSGFLGNWTRKA
jgi:hypothetical protein